jgi:CheY-like chemotaxis protein
MCKILLVEDDRDIREAVAGLLNFGGHWVEEADNGRQALDWLSTHREDPPCLAIVDMMMPVMDGRELIGTLRSDPDWRGLYIIVFSATRSITDVANTVPANAFWPKPARVELFERIRVHCPYHARLSASNSDARRN